MVQNGMERGKCHGNLGLAQLLLSVCVSRKSRSDILSLTGVIAKANISEAVARGLPPSSGPIGRVRRLFGLSGSAWKPEPGA